MKKILVVEDDNDIHKLIKELLEKEHYIVKSAYSGTEALTIIKNNNIDLILLDLMLPGINGEDIVKKVNKTIPIIVISAKTSSTDKAKVLLDGANDYITKLFEKIELLARIQVQLRMSHEQDKNLKYKDIELLEDNKTMKIQSHQITLTRTEYTIMRELLLNPNKVVTKNRLLDLITTDAENCDESSLKVHISNIRKKIRKITLEEILTEMCLNYQVEITEQSKNQEIQMNNTDILNKFISSKEIEGCSTRTLNYYKDNITKMLDTVNLSISEITTEILRNYLANYKNNSNAGMVTIDNIRRTLSSFFAWLENEDYIVKSPVRRIHKVKETKKVKETFTDENLEKLRDTCSNVRDLAILELLISTGMRVGELTRLNITDMNFQERSCIVLGKGNSEREVYFSAKSKMYIKKYLETRTDKNEALFVSLIRPYNRLGISGIEIAIRNLGKEASINKVHPHKFRRTMATMAIDKGMPVEQVQKLLGHIKIDTTMEYAMVSQNNVKNSHRKYVT